ncbi:magnesium transporter [Ureibacillus terrenus]|uniref:Magnesium transporter MgtE n=1 Tax=Ureibacillus terrenus TaxID=118246 RepID=A0A540V5D2_9BACL|nr:magnesium transporter [Ureibacillus terrenus]MED3661837.1 magnesium transporter [Ureibacillus terrenus]MED3763140.1 magnesium transporter [Ureibacillus terrenus]TQE91353.1 magnesium transporter [Ureibacillus terrenus]
MIEEKEKRDLSNNEEGQLLKWLTEEKIDEFRENFLALHAYDQARFYMKVGPDIRRTMYHFLSPEEMAEIFEALELDDEEVQGFIKEMDPTYAANMLSYMYTDDVVDVLNELDKADRDQFLKLMDEETAEEVTELLGYEKHTAGSLMTTEYVSVQENSTVRSAMNVLRREAPDAETIYYIFVVDENHRLTGVLSLRDLIVADEDALIRDIMNNRVVYAKVTDDQEKIAQIFKDYNFLAFPVVDDNLVLQGIITVDDIIDVIDEEASDDYSKLAGISDIDDIDAGPFKAARQRLPWLVMLLFLGMLTATLMGQFESTLEKVALLAVFIPLISGTSGNSGTQALAVVVRGIATGEIDEKSKLKMIFREMGTGLITGLACGLIVVLVVFLWKHSMMIGLLVGTAIFCSIFVATLAGSFIPLLIHKLGIDPAVASGPFITTLNDITSILIYLGLATLLLGQL